MKEQLDHIESLWDLDPLDFIIKKKLENQVQDNKTPSKPIPSKSPQTSLKQPLPFFPIHIPSRGLITYPLQKMATRFAPLALPA